ncbi:hypothetical protein KI387_028038, partial [Taxus chinensis]
MELQRMMSCEGFEAHVKDMESEHQALPHLGKCNRESPSASDESALQEEILRTITGAHLIPPDDLALALGVLVPEVIIDKY